MAVFQKKEEGRPLPVPQISQMKQQGYDNNQIITALQNDGYSSAEIFDAMNQAEMHGSPPPMQVEVPEPMYKPEPQNFPSSSSNNTEELVEAIIEEKWQGMAKDISKIIEWKNRMDTKLQLMEQNLGNLKEQYDRLHEAVLGKLTEYDKSILNVGAELKAMERTFSDVLPEFNKSVQQLSTITKTIKKK